MVTTPNLWSGTAKALVGALYGDPAKAADLESDKAAAGLNLEKTRGERMKNDSLAGLDASFAALGENPQSYNENLAMALGSLGRAGVTDPSNFLTPFLAGRSMIAGEVDADKLGRGAIITSGSSPSENFAATSNRADQISRRDAGESMSQALAVERAKPRTMDQIMGARFGELPMEQQTLAAQLKAFGEVVPRNITFNGSDGKPAQRIGVGPGYFDDAGQFTLPKGNAAIYSAMTEAATPGQATGFSSLTPTNITNVQKDIMKNQRAVGIAEDMLKTISPQSSGLVPYLLGRPEVGIANQLVPGVIDEGLKYLPGQYNVAQTKLDRKKLSLDIQQMRESLMNEDGKLSDKDQDLINGLTGALNPDVEDGEAADIVKYAIGRWQQNVETGQNLLREGIDLGGGSQPTMTPADNLPSPQTIQEYQAIPPGAQYKDPDTGEIVTKGR